MAQGRRGNAVVLALALFALLQVAAAKTYIVGDDLEWGYPPGTNASYYDEWAAKNPIAEGDNLIFNYALTLHNVQVVSAAEYEGCILSTGMKYTSGSDTITLSKAGDYYFFCSVLNHCDRGMKMKVSVKAGGTAPTVAPTTPATSPATPPLKAGGTAPTVAPTTPATRPATPPVKAPAAPAPILHTAGSKSKSNTALIAGIVGGVVGAIVLIGCVVVIIWMRRRKRSKLNDDNNNNNNNDVKSLESSEGQSYKPIESGLLPGAHRYSYAEIVAATYGFKHKIGSGGFGPVYYGRLSNDQEVAIKTLDANSHQGSQEFTNEVELLSRIHHKNLVRFLGFCEEGKHQILVYEFLHKGTVQEHLYGSKAAHEPLDLKLRLDIAVNAAQGLEYLHDGCNPNIIHRDIKSNNILLTDKYVAKVADFGLSKLGAFDKAASHVLTVVKGTPGYLDPEYFASNALTEKSDVFSFGVVLLEMLCGRPPIVNSPNPAHSNICSWARASMHTGSIDDMLDSVIVRERPNMDVIWKVAELALSCVEPQGKHRPSMQHLVRELRDAVSLNGSSGSLFGNATSSNSFMYSLPSDSNNSMVQPRVR